MRISNSRISILALLCAILVAGCADEKPAEQDGPGVQQLLQDFDEYEIALATAGCGFTQTLIFKGLVEERYKVELVCSRDPAPGLDQLKNRKTMSAKLKELGDALLARGDITDNQRQLISTKVGLLHQGKDKFENDVVAEEARHERIRREEAERIARDERASIQLISRLEAAKAELQALGCAAGSGLFVCPVPTELETKIALYEQGLAYSRLRDSLGSDPRFPWFPSNSGLRTEINEGLRTLHCRISESIGKACGTNDPNALFPSLFSYSGTYAGTLKQQHAIRKALEEAIQDEAVKTKLTQAVASYRLMGIEFSYGTSTLRFSTLTLSIDANSEQIKYFIRAQTF